MVNYKHYPNETVATDPSPQKTKGVRKWVYGRLMEGGCWVSVVPIV